MGPNSLQQLKRHRTASLKTWHSSEDCSHCRKRRRHYRSL